MPKQKLNYLYFTDLSSFPLFLSFKNQKWTIFQRFKNQKWTIYKPQDWELINKLELKVSGVPIREKVQLRIVPDKKSGMAEIRFWYDNKLVGIQKVKTKT